MRTGRNRWAEWKGVGSYGTIGLEMVLSVLFGLFVGRWLDGKLGTEPYIMLCGFGLGVAAAVRALLRSLREMKRETARDGFRESETDRPARFALEQRKQEAGLAGELEASGDAGLPESLESPTSSPKAASEPEAADETTDEQDR